MNPHDMAKDAIGVATTAGLGKDVIALLKDKVELTEKIAALEQEKSVLHRENVSLKKQIETLQQQLAAAGTKQEEFDPEALKILKVLFYQGERSIEYMADLLDISRAMAEYQRDALVKAGMIRHTRSRSGDYDLTVKGREFFIALIKKTDQAN